MHPLVLVLLAYVVGATPTSYWVGKWGYGKDLRTLGSGNLGATNTFRVLGWKAAVPVMAVDVLKGWCPVWFFPSLAAEESIAWTVAYGAAAIVGHVFSFWVGFRGGKGVATSAGALSALAPLPVLVAFVVWVLVVATSRMVSLGSIAAALAVPVTAQLTPQPGGTTVRVFLWLLGAFVIWAHRSNIRRILRGEEARFGRSRNQGEHS